MSSLTHNTVTHSTLILGVHEYVGTVRLSGVVQARVSQNGTFYNNALLSGISMGRDAFYRQFQ